MSGKPYPEGVKELFATVVQINTLTKELQTIKADSIRLATSYTATLAEYRIKQRELADHLEKMDLKATGNTGWERRFEYFLLEFYRNLKEQEET